VPKSTNESPCITAQAYTSSSDVFIFFYETGTYKVHCSMLLPDFV